jgi:hypothetical protein
MEPSTTSPTTSSSTASTDPTDSTDPTVADSSTSTTGDDATSGPHFPDFGGIPDAPNPTCSRRDPTGAELAGYIWISNAAQGTVSKIETETLVEVGRYITRPDGAGSPSRTSVNRNGDVAVANRSGGLTMIRANVEQCLEPANTSSGPDDVLPWPDGCVEWHTPMVYASQRPVAWTAGTFDDQACLYVDQDVWTSGANAAIDVLLLDGDTGVIEDMVAVPGVAANFYGIYGGAVDSGGNFWGSQLGTGSLVRTDLATFDVESWPMEQNGYGMTVDANDRIWTCSSQAARFDYATETWESAMVNGNGGCAPGPDGTLWLASNPIVQIDIETLAVVNTINMPDYVHGISVDFSGRVWGVTIGTNAYRVDPGDGTTDLVSGLVGAYTYSDMTGMALAVSSGQL